MVGPPRDYTDGREEQALRRDLPEG